MDESSETHPVWDSGNALAREATLARILAQVSRVAMQGDSLEESLQAIVDCIVRKLPVSIASIIVLNEPCTQFVHEVWAGDVELAWPGRQAWPVSKGVAGRCARTGEPQLVTDPATDPDYVAGNSGVRTEYLVPIRHRGRMHAVLNVESVRTDLFTPQACPVFDAIAAQVAGAIHSARLVEELEQANRKLRELSMMDGLTGIANRRCFDERLAEEVRHHARTGHCLALLMVDVDHFKLLNDAQGHLRGDQCLRELARMCRMGVRSSGDVVARYGGEELVLLLLECNQTDAVQVAEKLRTMVQNMRMPHPSSPVTDCVTVSIGVTAAHPDAALLPDVLIEAADAAMYEAKALGRNRVRVRTL